MAPVLHTASIVSQPVGPVKSGVMEQVVLHENYKFGESSGVK